MTARILLLVLALSLMARAVLPNLSDEERFNLATDIVIGEVRAVARKEEKVKAGTDFHYTCEVVVQTIVKGHLKPGDVITVKFNQTGKRPPMWAGPVGQNEALKPNTRAKLYLTQGLKSYSLLEPNGWDPAP